MKLRFGMAALALALASATLASMSCGAQIVVRRAPDSSAKSVSFHDGHFHVRFEVPPGWNFTTKDGEVSRFHADVASAKPRSSVRAVASMGFNPYPYSTFSGAMFYFSVEKHASAKECAQQATPAVGTQEIGGIAFQHGHQQGGDICTEMRDDVYTAYRKRSCLRFDLKVNTFCAVSSGAQEITGQQLHEVEQRMAGILSSVKFDWQKSGANAVPAPEER